MSDTAADMTAKRAFLVSALTSLTLTAAFVTGCDKGEKDKKEDGEKKAEKKGATKKEETKTPPAPPEKKVPELDLSGPLPPETSTVIYGVNGALIPLGCYDSEKKKVMGGPACLELAKKDDEVFLGSPDGNALDKIDSPRNALCEVADKPQSLGTPALDTGASYLWAVYPKSLGKTAIPMGPDSRAEAKIQLSDEESTALLAAAAEKAKKAAGGEVRSIQKGSLDVDGDGTDEVFYGMAVHAAGNPNKLLFSGLFMADGGKLDALRLIEKTRDPNDVITLRGGVDLDGDGRRELWIGVEAEGVSGEKAVVVGDKITALASWSCGA